MQGTGLWEVDLWVPTSLWDAGAASVGFVYYTMALAPLSCIIMFLNPVFHAFVEVRYALGVLGGECVSLLHLHIILTEETLSTCEKVE